MQLVCVCVSPKHGFTTAATTTAAQTDGQKERRGLD